METKKLCKHCQSPCPVGARGRVKTFCTSKCDAEWRRARWQGNKLRVGLRPDNVFVPGHKTWNKGLKGIHLSPSSEWKPGHKSAREMPIGAVSKRKDKNSENVRAYVKVGKPNIWRPRAVLVWELYHGPIPRGMVVHHKDRNTLNDATENLELVTRADHINEHREELLAAKAKK